MTSGAVLMLSSSRLLRLSLFLPPQLPSAAAQCPHRRQSRVDIKRRFGDKLDGARICRDWHRPFSPCRSAASSSANGQVNGEASQRRACANSLHPPPGPHFPCLARARHASPARTSTETIILIKTTFPQRG